MAWPVSWNAVDDRRHEVRHRADGTGQHETESDQEPEKDPAAPDAMAPAQRGALSSHLRLYNELG